jgi:hypothetical protein
MFKNMNLKYFRDYYLLIILSVFAIFPYLLIGKSSSILYLGDYYQRHAFLLAPVSGMFFAIMFKDMSKINFLQKAKINLNYYLLIFLFFNLVLLNYGNYSKVESYLFRKNLINELKSYEGLPRGDVELVGNNFPAELRPYEISHIFFEAYGVAGWWGTTSNSQFTGSPPIKFLKDKQYSLHNILNNYKKECKIFIYIKDDLKKIKRIKNFYIFRYKKYYKIDKVNEKC